VSEADHTDPISAARLVAFEIEQARLHSVKNSAHAAEAILDRLKRRLATLAPEIRTEIEQAQRHIHLVIEACSVLHVGPRDDKPVDVNKVVEESIGLMQGPLGRVEVLREYADIPLMWISEFEVREMLLSVLSNSIKAIKEGNPPNGKIRVSSAIAANKLIPAVVIRIDDNGVGIRPEQIPRLCEIGYSTWGGPGYGLYVAERIAATYGGTIHFESNSGLTSVLISIPLKRYVAA
jgi:signal transduction histidine kinase